MIAEEAYAIITANLVWVITVIMSYLNTFTIPS